MRTSSGRRHKVRVTISDNCFSLGWWMVMSEDEQGYAPASYLEPLGGSGSDDVHPEDHTNQGEWDQVRTYIMFRGGRGEGRRGRIVTSLASA